MTTDTPRTDAKVKEVVDALHVSDLWIQTEFCRQLERELAAIIKRVEETQKLLEGEHDAHMECHRRAEEAEQKAYPAIWLTGADKHWTVKIEINGEWITVIREFDGGGHSSHIVESLGIQAAINAARGKNG